jgi:hypothetical protein
MAEHYALIEDLQSSISGIVSAAVASDISRSILNGPCYRKGLRNRLRTQK